MRNRNVHVRYCSKRTIFHHDTDAVYSNHNIIYNFRTILSALHFNYNAKRESKVNDHGQTKLTIDYPKFKGGDATVREMKADQNYGNSNSVAKHHLKLYKKTIFYLFIIFYKYYIYMYINTFSHLQIM